MRKKVNRDVYLSLSNEELTILKDYLAFNHKIEIQNFMGYNFIKMKIKTAREIYNNLTFMGDEKSLPIKEKLRKGIYKEN